MRRRSNIEDELFRDTATWPESEYAELYVAHQYSEHAIDGIAYEGSASPSRSKELEKGRISIETDMEDDK